jgi:hypothetical protein
MKTLKLFNDLSKSGIISEQENAIDAMFNLIKKYNYPINLRVSTVEELKNEIGNGYNPDNHFIFYSDGYEVDVKIV